MCTIFFFFKIAEAEVVLEGIKLVMDSGLSPLIMESDSVNVVNLIARSCQAGRRYI